MKKRILVSFSIVATGALFAAIDEEKKPAAAKAEAGGEIAQALAGAEPKPTAEQVDFFEKKIRPVLSEKCYKCHSEKADKVKGGLVYPPRRMRVEI